MPPHGFVAEARPGDLGVAPEPPGVLAPADRGGQARLQRQRLRLSPAVPDVPSQGQGLGGVALGGAGVPEVGTGCGRPAQGSSHPIAIADAAEGLFTRRKKRECLLGASGCALVHRQHDTCEREQLPFANAFEQCARACDERPRRLQLTLTNERPPKVHQREPDRARIAAGLAQREALAVEGLCPRVIALVVRHPPEIVQGVRHAALVAELPVEREALVGKGTGSLVIALAPGDPSEVVQGARNPRLVACHTREIHRLLVPGARLHVIPHVLRQAAGCRQKWQALRRGRRQDGEHTRQAGAPLPQVAAHQPEPPQSGGQLRCRFRII
jgi:hypothetical protein